MTARQLNEPNLNTEHRMRVASLLTGILLLTSCSSGSNGFTYTEEGGLTVVEAENWTRSNSAAGINGLFWNSIEASGSDGTAIKLDGSGTAIPDLAYDVTFAESGTRYLWLRGSQYRTSSGVDISLSSAEASFDPASAQFTLAWQWQRVATLEVLAGQTISTILRARDESITLDKLLFTDDASLIPAGTGPTPTESPENSPSEPDPDNGPTTVIVVGGDSLSVDVGADAQITLPNTLSISASINHQSSGGKSAALQWATLDGPEDATFSDPTSAQTSVSFPLEGDYTLQLTAQAGNLTETDELTVSVLSSANQAPEATIVTADDTLALNQTLQLFADAQDDGLPDGVLFYWWSAISGPGEAFFGSQNQASTTVSFSQQGNYQIKLSVQDGVLNTLKTIDITVTDPVDTGPAQGTDESAAADFVVETAAPLDSASTYSAGSFRLSNLSAVATITSITIDLSSAAITDIVFDPLGTAGDSAFKDLTIDTGYASRQFSADNAGGYDQMQMVFNDFQPGEEVTFSIDLDPANVRGVAPPGDRHAASISGFEIAGATITVTFGDGSSESGRLFGTPGSETASQIKLRRQMPAVPVVSVVGVANPSLIDQDQQIVRISGHPMQEVQLFVSEAGLYLAGTPDGGFDIDPFEPNTIIAVQEHLITLDASGAAELTVQMPRSNPDAGFYIVQAAGVDTDRVGSASDPVLLLRN
jgi:hypothetical protein